MTVTALYDKRRAIAFADALDRAAEVASEEAAEAGEAGGEADRMLSLAQALGRTPGPPVLDEETKTVQRTRLVAAMEAEFGGAEGGPGIPVQRGTRGAAAAVRRRWGRRLAIGGIAIGLVGGGFGGVAAASTRALPGDALYPVKRTLEDLRLATAGSDEDRGKLYLALAGTRLDEVQRLLGAAKPGAAAPALHPDRVADLRRALSGMQSDATRGRSLLQGAYHRSGALQPMRRIADFTRTVGPRWRTLGTALPPQLAPVRKSVDGLLRTMDSEVAPLHLAPRPAPNGTAGNGSTGSGSSAAPGRSGGSGQQGGTSSAHPPHRGGSRPGGHPSAPGHPKSGIVGGLLNPLLPTEGASPSPGKDAGKGSPSPAPSDAKGRTAPGINVPPLLPGLPGLKL